MSKLHLPRRAKLWDGFVAGACGGLAGSVAMNQFQRGWSKAARALASRQGSEKQSSRESGESEDATMKVADRLAHAAGRQLSHEQKKRAGTAVHYAFGTLMGGLYGIAAEMRPRQVKRHAALSGMSFGASLFVGADELAVSKLGLSSGPAPLSSHLYALASHLVYGVTTGLVQAGLRNNLESSGRVPARRFLRALIQ